MRWLLVVIATLASAPAAYAQGATVQAVDDTLKWSPAEVTVKAGESVTWTWDGDPPHNVKSTSANWNVQSLSSGFSHPFPDPGTYDYLCQFHLGMTGRVIVTDAGGTPPPPPPPPPLSEQPFGNDQQPPSAFEVAETIAPRVTRLRLAPVRNGARVRFRLSEPAGVTVRFKLAGIAVKSVRRSLRAGVRSLVVRDRRLDGRYRVEVVARDLAGNRSRTRSASVTVP